MKIPNLWHKYTEFCDKSIDKPSFNFIALQGLITILAVFISFFAMVIYSLIHRGH
ncbi:MAG: hypothetical protein NC200_01365 [Candidatus Gastranaerophilales bacterium]|nr:hypothetical protein [Candidatus Gastranaerophilales bacterium]MCM1264822.1 hypothetical protein [Candidatus Gastranaerophilales bacterium]